MKLSKKMYELSEKMKALSNEARVFTDNGETDKALDKMKEFDVLKAEFAVEEKLYHAENFFNDDGKTKTVSGTNVGKDDTQKSAFFTALRNNFQGYGLTKGLMTEGTNASAGYLVPVDTQTKVNEYKSERFSFADYVTHETVSTNKGSRVYRNKNTSAAFTQVAEGGRIPLASSPSYSIVDYTIKDFGGIIPVTNDLMMDSDVNIEKEIIKHLGECKADTFNAQIKALIAAKAAVPVTTLTSIRNYLIKGLGGAYTKSSAIYTNDDGYAWLVNLQDDNHRDYFFFNPADSGKIAINIGGGLIVPVVHIPNSVYASAPAANNKVDIPFVLGDLKAAFTIFDRQQMSVTASNTASIEVTDGNNTTTLHAFQDNLTFFKAFLRADFKTIDTDAFINGVLTV